MSKTTAALLFILMIVIGVLFYVKYVPKHNPIINSLIQPSTTPDLSTDTILSLSTNTSTVNAGQTITIAVLIHNNPGLQPDLVQFELTYDPQTVTIKTVTPGGFFTHPIISLQNIDPVAGRITYALRCSTKRIINCVDKKSKTLATITASINPGAATNSTSFTFLPKTIVRNHTGKDVLKNTKGMHLHIVRSYIPAVTSSVASSGANVIPTTIPKQ